MSVKYYSLLKNSLKYCLTTYDKHKTATSRSVIGCIYLIYNEIVKTILLGHISLCTFDGVLGFLKFNIILFQVRSSFTYGHSFAVCLPVK